MTHLDLFSGIGGFAIAAQRCGFETIGFSEIDPYASSVLKKHWPHIPNYGDIKNVPKVECDLLTGGFPCQPFSVAGKRRGKEDDRHLWPAMLSVIEASRPAWVLGENVAGIINMELDRVLSDLEAIGYSCWPLVIPACATDAQHRRDRVWILANSIRQCWRTSWPSEMEKPSTASTSSASKQSEALANSEIHNRRTRLRKAGTEQNGCESANGCSTLANTSGNKNRGIQQRGIPANIGPSCNGTIQACCWLPEPGVGRVADGIPNRSHRLKCLGNAIVPQVAEEIIRAIVLTVHENPPATP